MRYVGMFNPAKVAYDGARLAPGVPIAARALTPAVAEALAPIVPAKEGAASFERPEPGYVAGPPPEVATPVVVAAETPEGRPVAMRPVAVERDEAPVYDYGPAPVPINDRPVNGPPRSRAALDRATVSVTADDWIFVALGVAALVAGGVYVATRKKRRAA